MRQGGAAALLIMMIVLMLGVWMLEDLPMMNAGNAEEEKASASVLAQARDALIGRAIMDASMPGSLPCPDVDNDGVAELLHGNECPAYIGRLPWKTLRLPDIRDAHGERLWYALSRAFRDDDSAEPINSDTPGTLKVFAQDGATELTSAAVAVIFAPGGAVGNQIRDAVSENCRSTGTSLARNLCAYNYLDSSEGISNASSTGTFIAGAQSGTFNDRILVVMARDIMPLVEKRVARELKGALQAYYAANGYYPYPAKYDVCSGSACDSSDRVCRGRIPMDAAAAGTEPLLLQNWFVRNQWYREIYYSVGSGALASSANLGDPVCTPKLTLSGVQVDALFFTPGTPIGTQVRPSNALDAYLEDGENRDGWGVNANDLYVAPSSRLNDRDRVYTLP